MEFERRNGEAGLRTDLELAAADPKSSEIVWTYALRKLFLAEEGPVERFELVFSERLQGSRDEKRLGYAAQLLISNGFSKCTIQAVPGQGVTKQRRPSERVTWIRGGPTDGSVVRGQFLEAFERATSVEAAEVALSAFIQDDAATNVDWTAAESASFRRAVQRVLEDPAHPLQAFADRQKARLIDRFEARFGRVLRGRE